LPLSQEQLSKSLFPIGELTKPEVREIAAQMELVTAEKKGFSRAVFYRQGLQFFTTKTTAKEGLIIQIDKNIYDSRARRIVPGSIVISFE
jgi:tRNA-specific 2-thiouridylase